LTAKRNLVLGLDFGGTKLAAGVVDLTAKQMIDAAQTPTCSGSSAADGLVDMLDLVERLQDVDKVTGVGVSFGGHVRHNKILRSLHVRGWSDFPLLEALRDRFGDCEVRIANDANAMAMAEWKFGAGRGANSLLYLTVSTGIGGGIILDSQLVEGRSGMAGEIGHTKVVLDGPLCTCGGRGCLEALAAGPAIVRHAQALLAAQPSVASLLSDHSRLSSKIIADCANQGDELAISVLVTAGQHLGVGIANALNLLDVERVVIGGGVSRAGPVWWDSVLQTIRSNVLPWPSLVDVRRSEFGVHEGIWGAAALL
jgi:glucokinase